MRIHALLFILAAFLLNGAKAQYYYDTLTASTNDDAYVRHDQATTNYNTDTKLYTKKVSGAKYRTFIQYDLTSIPQDAIIISASLEFEALAVDNSQSHPLYVSRADTAWSGSSITWSNQPGEITSDQVSIGHNKCNSTGTQSFDVKSHVEYFIHYPHLNYGWVIRLQSESGSTARGIDWASSSHATSSYHPQLIIEYILPIEIEGAVTHCTNGNSDGSIEVTLSGGAGAYDYYYWYKKLYTDNGSYTGLENGTNVANIDVDNLSDGLYMLYVDDTLGNREYKYFLVGEEGDTTDVNISWPNTAFKDYMEDAFLKLTHATPADSMQTGGSATSVYASYSPSIASYSSKSLLKYKMDFDQKLDFTLAENALISYGHYQHNQSDNDGWLKRVTEPWEEDWVTWGVRPAVTATDRVSIPGTTTNGYETRNDTLNVLDFVEYWQENPDENYGWELSLQSYDHGTLASLAYRSSDYLMHDFYISYTVKPDVETAFNDTTNLGSITVNVQNGDGPGPYTYLISYSPLPLMDSIWVAVKDSLPIDSLTLFRGSVQSQNHTFTNLRPERYYIGVYDNNGTRILTEEAVVGPDITFFSNTDVDYVGDSMYVHQGASTAHGALDLQVERDGFGGFEFENLALGGMVVGFNATDDQNCNSWSDFDYAVRMDSAGNFDVVVSGSVVHSDTTYTRDKIRVLQENYTMYFIINDTVVHTEEVDGSQGHHFRPELLFTNTKGKIKGFMSVEHLFAPKAIDYVINQPECHLGNASITINSIGTSYWGITGVSYDIIEVSGDTSVLESSPATTLPATIDLAAGDYEIEYSWTSTSGTYSLTEEFTVGYPIYWNLLDDYFTTIDIPNDITTNTSDQEAEAISQNELEASTDGWVTFNVKTKKYYAGIPATSPFADYAGASTASTVSIRSGAVSMLDANNDPIIRVRLYNLGGDIINKIIAVYDETVSPTTTEGTLSIYDNGPVKIDLASGDFDVYYDGSSTSIGTVAEGTSTTHKAFAEATNATILDSYTSFCDGLTTSELCGELDYTLDGSYYVTNNGYFCFVYNEEYNDPNIEFNLYNQNNVLVATQDDFDIPDMIHGENRVVLELFAVDCTCKGYFVLEVINSKNEKQYLRFYSDKDGTCVLPSWCGGIPDFDPGTP